MIIESQTLPLPTPLKGTHFHTDCRISCVGSDSSLDHARRMSCLHCDLSEILELAKPPDPDLVDLIEQALLLGQIDVRRSDLAYLWLSLNSQVFAV